LRLLDVARAPFASELTVDIILYFGQEFDAARESQNCIQHVVDVLNNVVFAEEVGVIDMHNVPKRRCHRMKKRGPFLVFGCECAGCLLLLESKQE
jgi:hypothetical protein